MNESKYVTEVQAAALAGVVHETINNWGTSGKIRVVEDKQVLAQFNANKPGRPCSRLYLRDEVLGMADHRDIQPAPTDIDDWWTVHDMAEDTGKSVRTVYRALKTKSPHTWRNTSGKIFVHPEDAVNIMDELDPVSESE